MNNRFSEIIIRLKYILIYFPGLIQRILYQQWVDIEENTTVNKTYINNVTSLILFNSKWKSYILKLNMKG